MPRFGLATRFSIGRYLFDNADVPGMNPPLIGFGASVLADDLITDL